MSGAEFPRRSIRTCRPTVDSYIDVIPAYRNALRQGIYSITSAAPDGVFTLGYSAECTWLDMMTIAGVEGLSLPPCVHIVGQDNWNFYGLHPQYAGTIYDRHVPFRHPLLFEDYIESASKFIDIAHTVNILGLPMRYIVLICSEQAKALLAYKQMNVQEIVQPFDPRLMDFLKSRRTSSSSN